MDRPFDQVWTGASSSGESDDAERTARDVRALLAGGSVDRVTLRVGSRAFGERVLSMLAEDELTRVVVVLGGAERLDA
jgi:hypothetical protein